MDDTGGFARETGGGGRRHTACRVYISSPVQHIYEDIERERGEGVKGVASSVEATRKRDGVSGTSLIETWVSHDHMC